MKHLVFEGFYWTLGAVLCLAALAALLVIGALVLLVIESIPDWFDRLLCVFGHHDWSAYNRQDEGIICCYRCPEWRLMEESEITDRVRMMMDRRAREAAYHRDGGFPCECNGRGTFHHKIKTGICRVSIFEREISL